MNTHDDLDRYSRQVRFPGIGEEGQRKLLGSRVAVVGCGALGTVSANALVRAGVGFVRVIDRDFIERNNLQRQLLFDEEDIAEGLPKAEAAARRLRKVNSSVAVEAAVAHLDAGNIAGVCGDVDLIVDGTDNFDVRFLVNDFAAKHRKPWIFASCVGGEGQSLFIEPPTTPCLRCSIAMVPPPGTGPTCETAGIVGTVSGIIANFQATEAIKWLAGARERINRSLLVVDAWENRVRYVNVARLKEAGDCPVCKKGRLDYLSGKVGGHATSLCGRNAVQVEPPQGAGKLDLESVKKQLEKAGPVTANRFLLRCQVDGYEMTVFADGRAIIKGTAEIDVARGVYARYLGG